MVRFRMTKITIKQFAILAEAAPTDDINLNTELDFKISGEYKTVGVNETFTFISHGSIFLKLELFCEFTVSKTSWESLANSENMVFPKDFLQIIASQTVGTARGILFCKTENTPFSEYIIPPINIAEMVNQDAAIKLSDLS